MSKDSSAQKQIHQKGGQFSGVILHRVLATLTQDTGVDIPLRLFWCDQDLRWQATYERSEYRIFK